VVSIFCHSSYNLAMEKHRDITTDKNGVKTSEMRYKPWGETRYTWTSQLVTNPAYELTKYQFTGQYSYASDFGLLFYNARFYDPALGRFTSADSIIPPGVQGLDRYAYVNNNPVRLTDPTGHKACEGDFETSDDCQVVPTSGPRRPYFSKPPVSKEVLEWTQWFGPTEFAYQGGSAWGYDDYCQGYHCGIDFGGEWGDPVSAGVYGEVYELGKGSGGYYVVIKTGDYYILYQALDGDFMVEKGDLVTPETILAGVGNHDADPDGGNDHLHLEVMHYSPYAIENNSFWGWRGDLIENPLQYMNQKIYELLVSVADTSPPNNVTFHYPEQAPLLQPSPMHRGGTVLWK
jgi:RHS repeat-associated protein